MTSTLVTYCSKEKRKDKTPLPAVERYLSERIKGVWARSQSENRPMLVLSGLLGLIRPDAPIMWYDKLLLPGDVGGMVDLVSHHLLGFRVEAVEYITENIWLVPAVKPYHDFTTGHFLPSEASGRPQGCGYVHPRNDRADSNRVGTDSSHSGQRGE